MTLNVSLTPQQEARIRERISSGEYVSASEVVRTALRLLDQQDELRRMKLEELRKEVTLGVAQAEVGEVETLDAAAIGAVKRRGRERLASSQGKKK